eukprot:TRINITY_DN4560_c1_g3_i1.p1 TRINITY_DN4560_c1_g3~~TRINITY_DN4560_c1_g3_i1.p1  ORF type:complete len:233 (+),score=43.07 TRINITY_DN4560_c1_g3_i1:529-1227(+)
MPEATLQEKEDARDGPKMLAYRSKFVEETLVRDDCKDVVDHAAAWKVLQGEFPCGEVPLSKLYPAVGFPLLMRTSEIFYDMVWSDSPWFARQFIDGGSSKKTAVVNQWTFMAEQLGGPPLFSDWRNSGGQALVAFTHEVFTMSDASLKRWMQHMTAAVDKSLFKEKAPAACAIYLEWCYLFGQRMMDHTNQQKIIAQEGEPVAEVCVTSGGGCPCKYAREAMAAEAKTANKT